MKRKKPKKKHDVYELVQDRLEKFSERISEIEGRVSEIEETTRRSFQDYLKYIELVSQNIYGDILIENELYRLEELPSGDISLFINVINRIQKKMKIHNQIRALRLGVVTLPFHSQIGVMLKLSTKWKLPFKEIGSYLVDKLGKEAAKKLVEEENLAQYYGKDAIQTWKSLLKE